MYLARVHVKGFRNLDDVEVDFCAGLTVLVGENNIGKTNLIDAIRFALGSASTGNRLAPRLGDVARCSTVPAFSVDLVFADVKREEMAAFIECLSYDPQAPDSSRLEVHYRWSWDDQTQKYQERRWGGPEGSGTPIPSEVLQSIPFVYLEPLRDALATLTAGRASRVGALMRRLRHTDEKAGERIESIMQDANSKLEKDGLVKRVVDTIQDNIQDITSAYHAQSISLVAAVQKFESIVNNLSLVLRLGAGTGEGTPEPVDVTEIRENGLGYNNLLYIATVLADLENCTEGDVPILCVEEPEAHLHPQLQLLLGEYFRRTAERRERRVQVVITTHSPNLASHLPLTALNVLHRARQGEETGLVTAPMWACGLAKGEILEIERLLDVTKACLFFAQAVIFVEGVCEQLLLPELARQAGVELEARAVSVIPTHGLSFQTLTKLFGPGKLRLPCAVVADQDPKTTVLPLPLHSSLPKETPWLTGVEPGTTSTALDEHGVLRCRNTVTLEYDLALPPGNAERMVKVWRQAKAGCVTQFKANVLAELPSSKEKAMYVWQATCLASGGRYKAAFAQALADSLRDEAVGSFGVPPYIAEAFTHVGVLGVAHETDGNGIS